VASGDGMEATTSDKLFYKIGEVAELTSLRPSVLRYWETEFSDLQPIKSRSGQRLYGKRDLEVVLEIKKLLYIDKLTIEGARRTLAKQGTGRIPKEMPANNSTVNLFQIIREVKEELKRIKDKL
jgi:DNA-binding transcriptional MerR regulator